MAKLGFVTCVKLGFRCIEEIYRLNYKIDLVITLKDDLAKNKSGRVFLDKFCNYHNIPLLKVNHINEINTIKDIQNFNLDWLFIIGWSQIANNKVLAIPKFGVLGMHPSLLPVGRGRASISNAILKSLDFTGVTFFKLVEEVDAGPILSQVRIAMSASIDATKLYEKIQIAHVELLRKSIKKIMNNEAKFIEQDHSKATFWEGRKPKDGEIKMNMSLIEAQKLVRATTYPYPGAFCFINDKKYIVWEAMISNKKPLKSQIYLTFPEGFLIFRKYEIEFN